VAPTGPALLDRRLLFVTGKGGVGKTTIAAALAMLAAGHGKRTLVCEVDAKGNLADFFETGLDRLRAA
jgi:anion-transporting  ArsA/GET3 family ATPase